MVIITHTWYKYSPIVVLAVHAYPGCWSSNDRSGHPTFFIILAWKMIKLASLALNIYHHYIEKYLTWSYLIWHQSILHQPFWQQTNNYFYPNNIDHNIVILLFQQNTTNSKLRNTIRHIQQATHTAIWYSQQRIVDWDTRHTTTN